MIRTLKVLSLLLAYPTREIAAAAPAFPAILDEERLLPEARRASLRRLAAELAEEDGYELEARYVLLFDRTRSLSLHLFEHVHGESRDRGEAMVELGALYERHGLAMPRRELPDFLPLFLEFLATRPLAEARDHLADIAHIVCALKGRLDRRRSVYAEVFAGLESLAAAGATRKDVEAMLDAPDDDPGDPAALDRYWAEAPVTFGPGEAGTPDTTLRCPPCGAHRAAAAMPEATRTDPPRRGASRG